MDVMIFGGDTRILDLIEKKCHAQLDFILAYKLTALNRAIEATQVTAFDLVINTVEIPLTESIRLSDLFRAGNINSNVPVISCCCDSDIDPSVSECSSNELNYIASNVEEIIHCVSEILKADRGCLAV